MNVCYIFIVMKMNMRTFLIFVLFYLEISSTAEIDEVSFEQVLRGLQDGSLVYLDVRNVDELKKDGKIKGSVNVPLPELEEAFKLSPADFQAKYDFPKPALDARNVVVACLSGQRSLAAVNILKGLGYNYPKLYRGSFLDWKAHGGPFELYVIPDLRCCI